MTAPPEDAGVGAVLDLVVGPPAHGGHCVARADGRVVFVRHALPGERVRARVTEARRQFWRADAVEVLEASADRVPSVWPAAGPGGIGGGELAHVALPAQRAWKTAVLRETLTRIGHVDLDALDGEVHVEALPGDDERGGLGTRTRIELVVDAAGKAGMFRARSHDVVALDDMPLAVPAIAGLGLFAPGLWRRFAPGTRLEVVAPSIGAPVVVAGGTVVDPADPRPGAGSPQGAGADRGSAERGGRGSAQRGGRGGRESPERGGRRGGERGGPERDAAGRSGPGGPEPVHARVNVRELVATPLGDITYRVSAQGFWQVHREAPAALVAAVLDAVQPHGGGRVVDLYSGAGLFTVPLARVVGEQGRVDAFESDASAVADARRNLHAHPEAVLHTTRVDPRSLEPLAGARLDAVVLDPPRSGAGPAVMAALAGLRPGRIVYVACDPAALARDVAAARESGYRLRSVRGLDLFPHTHHLEAVAVLEPSSADAPGARA